MSDYPEVMFRDHNAPLNNDQKQVVRSVAKVKKEEHLARKNTVSNFIADSYISKHGTVMVKLTFTAKTELGTVGTEVEEFQPKYS